MEKNTFSRILLKISTDLDRLQYFCLQIYFCAEKLHEMQLTSSMADVNSKFWHKIQWRLSLLSTWAASPNPLKFIRCLFGLVFLHRTENANLSRTKQLFIEIQYNDLVAPNTNKHQTGRFSVRQTTEQKVHSQSFGYTNIVVNIKMPASESTRFEASIRAHRQHCIFFSPFEKRRRNKVNKIWLGFGSTLLT